MARARNIKPGFFANEHLAECDPLARILFAGLWCLADRSGRLEDRPKRIRAELLPYDNCDAAALLDQLQENGFLLRYSRDDKQFIQVLNFNKHQNPHVKEAASTIPDPFEPEQPPEGDDTPTDPVSDEHSTSTVQAPDQSDTNPADSLSLDSLIPDSLIPDCLEELADTDKSEPVAETLPAVIERKPAKQPKGEETDHQRACRTTWDAYSDAYRIRYGTEPVRNAKVNSQVKQLVLRLGGTEAPGVAAFFVTINDAFYIRRAHELGILISNAEGIRTQWATGRQMNGTTARQLEQTQANMNAALEAGQRIRDKGGKRNAFL